MEILPIYCIRTGGSKVENIEALKSYDIMPIISNINNINNNIYDTTNEIVDDLYKEISFENDKKKRNDILELRRKILSEAKIRKINHEQYCDLVHEKYHHKIKYLKELYVKKDTHAEEYKNVYSDNVSKERKLFKDLIKDNDFMKSVLLASDKLFRSIPAYNEIESLTLSKKERNTEEALIGYYIRSATKTSPFASFTSVTLCKIGRTAEDGKMNCDKGNVIMFDRKCFVDILYKLKTIKHIRQKMVLLLNPTIIKDNNRIYYYYEKTDNKTDTEKDNSVVFTWSVEINDTLKYILSKIQEHEVRYDELIAIMVKESDCSEEQIEIYIEGLIESGILEIHYPISELNHNYFEKVLSYLVKQIDINKDASINNLIVLEEAIKKYKTCSTEKMLREYDQIKNIINDIYTTNDLLNKPNYVIYQDSYLQKIKHTLPPNVLDKVADDLADMSKFGTICYLSQHIKKINIKHVLDKYWSGAKQVNLISYFNKYCEVMNSCCDNGNIGQKNEGEVWNPFMLKEIKELVEYYNSFSELYRDAIIDSDNIARIDKSKYKELLGNAPNYIKFSKYFSVYMQRDNEDNGPWVLNEMRAGNYKYLSRFLYLSEYSGNAEIRNDYKHQDLIPNFEDDEEGVIYAELGGIFKTNNNVHSKLTKYIIRYPGCYINNKTNNLIELNELYIKHDGSGNPILFSERLNKQVIPIHIGLNNEKYFPRFYQFILNFEPSRPYLPVPHQLARPNYSQEQVLPRVMYGNLLLSRKKWIFRKDSIPVKTAELSEADYYYNLKYWQVKQGLPSQLFIIKTPYQVESENKITHIQSLKSEGNTKKISKPYYYDFDSPLQTQYLTKHLSDIPDMGVILFEECYPDFRKGGLKQDEGTYICEYFFELKNSKCNVDHNVFYDRPRKD